MENSWKILIAAIFLILMVSIICLYCQILSLDNRVLHLEFYIQKLCTNELNCKKDEKGVKV
jgi:cell division protein FtsL